MDLIADIGGTNSRCALLDDKGRIVSAETFENDQFASLEGLLGVYLEHRRASDRPRRAALAVAAPVLGDDVGMINIGWNFKQSELKERLALASLTVVNDFAALAWALPDFRGEDRVQVGGGAPRARMPLAVLGPGTGFGVATLVPSLDGWTAVAGEGGHVTLPASTSSEAEVIAVIRDELGHCSAERVLSGPGLARLYAALAQLAGRPVADVEPPDVTALARAGEPLAARTLEMFFALLGTVAADVALTVGAQGGVFIAGGIVPQLLDAFKSSPFRERFIAKGRYRDYLDRIPTYVITAPMPALRGLRALLGYR